MKYLRCVSQATFPLHHWFTIGAPGQVFPFLHIRLLLRIPPMQVLLQELQLPHEAQAAANVIL